ncbi:sulfite exporter TauE/SafE family protein [Candidatus Izimaplasma bacterium]|nr:sulfite exporter TauE/SafE family protein [Candidatus Izimaplasma bacterium]
MDILIYLIGGILAGMATGLVGLSAATIIAPLFATFLGMDPFVAVGIALASDVFASAISSGHYIKNKNINLKDAYLLGGIILAFVILGSILSQNTNPYNLNSTLNIFVVILGIRFLVYPVKDRGSSKIMQLKRYKIPQIIIWGIVIGLISGFFGAGGGLSILAVLTMLLGYGLKNGVGTSVFIMTFVALVGAITHFVVKDTIPLAVVITSISALVGANFASMYANKINEVKLNRVIGVFLILFGTSLILVFYIQ